MKIGDIIKYNTSEQKVIAQITGIDIRKDYIAYIVNTSDLKQDYVFDSYKPQLIGSKSEIEEAFKAFIQGK